eukprot:GEMP01116340.1.p1 GENE.GEMP01116340.1~~GEMP01116340.1.p1  ORF type:complete len:119 (+),score=1.67 GEMP01116340.1:168-524(+)
MSLVMSIKSPCVQETTRKWMSHCCHMVCVATHVNTVHHAKSYEQKISDGAKKSDYVLNLRFLFLLVFSHYLIFPLDYPSLFHLSVPLHSLFSRAFGNLAQTIPDNSLFAKKQKSTILY